jgi:hypothetical protein
MRTRTSIQWEHQAGFFCPASPIYSLQVNLQVVGKTHRVALSAPQQLYFVNMRPSLDTAEPGALYLKSKHVHLFRGQSPQPAREKNSLRRRADWREEQGTKIYNAHQRRSCRRKLARLVGRYAHEMPAVTWHIVSLH